MSSEGHGNRPVRSPDTTRDQRSHQEITLATAILFRNSNPCIALICKALPHPAGEIVAAFYLGVVRPDFIPGKSKSTLVGELMLFWEFKVHDSLILSGVANKGRSHRLSEKTMEFAIGEKRSQRRDATSAPTDLMERQPEPCFLIIIHYEQEILRGTVGTSGWYHLNVELAKKR